MELNKSNFLKKNSFSFNSLDSGKNILILCGVHGNELTGIKTFDYFKKQSLKIKNGKVTFLLCNRKAIELNCRYVEENLNRCFLLNRNKIGTYEEKVAEIIKEIMQDYDICLDLHNSTSKHSESFVICEQNAYKYIQNFPCRKVVCGFDTFEPGGTDYYMNLIGKIGICVECGPINNKNSINFTKKLIKALLINTKSINLINSEINLNNNFGIFKLSFVYISKHEFLLNKNFSDFQEVNKNELIGLEGNKKVLAPFKGYILFASNISKNNIKEDEAFLLLKKLNLRLNFNLIKK